jgi:long-chain acyl-CoA synthetase
MVEYVISDITCQMNIITSVTCTLGDKAFEYVNSQTELATMCVSPDESTDTLIKYKNKYRFEGLKKVTVFDPTPILPEDAEDQLKKAEFNVFYFSELVKDSDDIKVVKLEQAKPDSVMTLCYTSGTTGLPKGAKITQRNAIAEICIFDVIGITLKD